MLIIGLTGGIGSGKTTVAELFAQKGILVIDTDQLSRDITRPELPALKKIVAQFGDDILLPDKTLNRAKLRALVFQDAKKRIWLEQLLHPLIRAEMHRQIETAKSPYCIVVIPLLLETKPNPLINRILVVDASEEQQLQRAQARDKLSHDEINAILKTQVNREHRLAAADDVIYNYGSVKELIEQTNKLHHFYVSLCTHV